MAPATKTTSFYIKRTIGLILLLALAAVFFISAISKMDTLDAFEWTFIDLGIKSNTTAAIIARLFIGLELLIGTFLVLHLYLKAFTYPITLIILVLFTGYLAILVVQEGNTGNCGCFGEWIYMKPIDAIWKNIAMIAATLLLMYLYPVKPYKHQEWITAFAGMAALVVPVVLMPLNMDNKPEKVNKDVNLNALYEEKLAPVVELRRDKHIIAFMSLTCPHCRKAAYLLHIIRKKHPQLPIYIVLSGHPDQQEEFFKETQSYNVPHMLMRDSKAFNKIAGDSVPAIFWVNNGVIEYESNYYQLDPATMEDWLKH